MNESGDNWRHFLAYVNFGRWKKTAQSAGSWNLIYSLVMSSGFGSYSNYLILDLSCFFFSINNFCLFLYSNHFFSAWMEKISAHLFAKLHRDILMQKSCDWFLPYYFEQWAIWRCVASLSVHILTLFGATTKKAAPVMPFETFSQPLLSLYFSCSVATDWCGWTTNDWVKYVEAVPSSLN